MTWAPRHARVRAVALPVDAPVPTGYPNALLSTPFGFAQLLLVPESTGLELGGGSDGARAGIGLAVEAGRLPASWSSALVALRLGDARRPVVRADDLGALLMLAETADAASEPHPDVVALESLGRDRAALPTLDALSEEGSVRGAAAVLGVHHSTVQARVTALTEVLGYDLRTSEGRTRYATARILQRLRDAHW